MILVPAKDIHLIENEIRPLLIKACDDSMSHPFVTAEDYLDSLKEGRVLLFTTIPVEFIVIIRFNIIKNKKGLTILFCSGVNYRKHWKNALQLCIDFATVTGCCEIRSTVRVGIAKDMFTFGFSENKYRNKHIEVFKAIGDSTQVFAQGEDAFSAEPRSNLSETL